MLTITTCAGWSATTDGRERPPTRHCYCVTKQSNSIPISVQLMALRHGVTFGNVPTDGASTWKKKMLKPSGLRDRELELVPTMQSHSLDVDLLSPLSGVIWMPAHHLSIGLWPLTQ